MPHSTHALPVAEKVAKERLQEIDRRNKMKQLSPNSYATLVSVQGHDVNVTVFDVAHTNRKDRYDCEVQEIDGVSCLEFMQKEGFDEYMALCKIAKLAAGKNWEEFLKNEGLRK